MSVLFRPSLSCDAEICSVHLQIPCKVLLHELKMPQPIDAVRLLEGSGILHLTKEFCSRREIQVNNTFDMLIQSASLRNFATCTDQEQTPPNSWAKQDKLDGSCGFVWAEFA